MQSCDELVQAASRKSIAARLSVVSLQCRFAIARGRLWREADVHLGGEVGVVLDACTASGDNSKYLLTSSQAGIANRS
jgi:hypothetical protein